MSELPKEPIAMILHCPECSKRHIDEGEYGRRLHHTHACQHCGFVWRPAIEFTVGVQFLPGFKNEPKILEPEGPSLELVVQGIVLKKGRCDNCISCDRLGFHLEPVSENEISKTS